MLLKLWVLKKRKRGVQDLNQSLTARELELLQKLADTKGDLNETRKSLCITHGTLKNHLHHIYQKLCVNGLVGAILEGLKQKLIHVEDINI